MRTPKDRALLEDAVIYTILTLVCVTSAGAEWSHHSVGTSAVLMNIAIALGFMAVVTAFGLTRRRA